MEKIHFWADSVSDIPKEKCDKYSIEIIPVTINIDGRIVREFYDITPEEYWDILNTNEKIPTTAQITPTQCLESYKKAREEGYTHVIGFTMNANGSGGFQSACIARQMFYEQYGEDMKIIVFDSGSYAYIFGRVVVEAAQMVENGESFDTVIPAIKNRLSRIEGFLGVYDIKHLKKSGRISGGAAFIGAALGLKPISHVFDGAVTVCDKARGAKGLIDGMVENTIRRVKNPEKQTVYILYTATPEEDIIRFEEGLLKKAKFKEVVRTPLGPSVCTNSGGRSIAVAFYGEIH